MEHGITAIQNNACALVHLCIVFVRLQVYAHVLIPVHSMLHINRSVLKFNDCVGRAFVHVDDG